MTTKEDELYRLFYSDYNAYEIKSKLNLNNNEYNKLLIKVKERLGLPSRYKRNTGNFRKYGKNKFFVAEIQDNEVYIHTYAPTVEYAQRYIYEHTTPLSNFIIKQATDPYMKQLIKHSYFTLHEKWDCIMDKYKLPYHDFYRLLNEIKKEMNLEDIRTTDDNRYIYYIRERNVWKIRKTQNGKVRDYGDFKDLKTAIHLRDYLESIQWDITKWNITKEQTIKDIIE